MRKRLLSIITTLVLCFNLLPIEALAAGTATNVTYYDWNSSTKQLEQKSCSGATEVEAGTTTWDNTWYVAKGDVTISRRVTVSGDVHLILADGCSLTVNGGIEVEKDNSLTIYGQAANTGKLTATGDVECAGIGADFIPIDKDITVESGAITINGGIIESTGGRYGAGIGSGYNARVSTVANNKTITINGGNVTSKGGDSSAGIGGGRDQYIGDIIINGGKVNATGGVGSAGIGSGAASNSSSAVYAGGSITITGGDITADGTGTGAGIGAAGVANLKVVISGGEITATGGSRSGGAGAGIGGCGIITISGGEITATGGADSKTNYKGGGGGAGIGGSSSDGHGTSGGEITITGGTIIATSPQCGAGIGGGGGKEYNGGDSGTIRISGGTITATGGLTSKSGYAYGGAGIGGGCFAGGKNISITGGEIEAYGRDGGAGIGGTKNSGGGEIVIGGGTIIAGGSGIGTAPDIGPGSGGNGGTATISGGTVTTNGDNNEGIGGTFQTTESGNAVVKTVKIDDKSKQSEWSGIIFEADNGGVYGTKTQTLKSPFTIGEAQNLLIHKGATLDAGSRLTNNGSIYVDGVLNGTVSGNLYCRLTLNNCTTSSATTTYNNATYVAPGTIVVMNADSPLAKFESNEVEIDANHKFTMPSKAVSVDCTLMSAVTITTQPKDKAIDYGETATLSIEASKHSALIEDLTYQWYKDDEAILGATQASYTTPDNLNAGTYSYKCIVSCGDEYTVNSDSATVTVSSIGGKVEITGDPGKTYDGTEVSMVGKYSTVGDGTIVVEYKTRNAEDSTYSTDTPKNAGDYTVRVTKAAGTNYKEACATRDFTIAPVSLTMVGLMAANRDYEAGNTKVDMTGGTLSGILSGDEGQVNAQIPAFGTIENDNAGNDKTVTCNITLTGDKAGNYILTPPTVTVDIWKVSSGVTTAPSAKTGLTYIGEEQELVNAGSTTTGTLQYSTSRNGTYSAAIPMGTDVKEYSIWYKVVGDANHTDSEPAEIKVSINRFDITGKELTITLGTALTYTGSEQTQSIASVKVGNMILGVGDYTVTGNTGTDAGTYTLTVTGQGSFEGSATKDFSIAKKSAISVADINKSYVYTAGSSDAVVSIDIAGYLPNNRGTTTYSLADNAAAYITDESVDSDGNLTYKVGTNGSIGDVTSLIVTANSLNYEAITVKVNIKIVDKYILAEKEESKVAITGSNTLIYGEALSTLTLNTDVAKFVENGDSAKEVTGTLAWVNPDAVLTVGTTVATWKFTPDSSHVNTYQELTGEVAITVNKATPDVTAVPTVADRTYNPTVSLTDADLVGGTVTGVDGNPLSGSWSWQTAGIIPTVNNSGYVAVFSPSDSTNYETVTKTITVTVSKATPYIATAPTAAAITYGDTLGASTLNGGTVQYSDSDATTVAGSFAWKDSRVKPSVSDSGTTAYRVVFNPSDTVNYNTAETDITLTVNKADNAPNMPSATMNVANSRTKVSDVTLPTGWVWRDADKNTALAVDTPVTATAEYNGADKGNYVNETISVTITRSACDHAHTEVRNAKAATCKETGYTGDTYCTDCGALLSTGTAIPLADHQGGTATCTKKAVCTVCGKEYGTLDANNHVHTEIKGAVAATCTAGGYTGDTYCTDCGVKTKTGTVTPALGHSYTGKVTTEPTTEKEGVRTYTCDRCGHSYTESIPKLPEEPHEHSYSGSVTKEATCTDNGVRTYSCSCGDSYTETIPALGHHYVSSVTKQPTTSSEGVMTYTCDRCGHSYTRAIAKLQDTNNNNPGENQPGGENTPDIGKPYIKDETGKEGWEVIKDEVDKTKDGDTVTVEMNGSAVVPGNVLDEIKGKDVDIVFDMGNGISWSVNGQSITGDDTGDIDFSVTVGTNTIPVDVINNVTGERQSRQISLAYDGEFGFTAVLSINMEASNAGLYANLFYFNEKTGELEFICADEIAADGTAELTFTHASDYAIVIDTEPMNVASNETADTNADVDSTTTESQDTETEATQTSVEVISDAWNPWWIIVIGIMVIVIGAGVFFVVKKREETEKE